MIKAKGPGMTESTPLKAVRVLFDEFHSESWTVSADRAREINPEAPGASSYAAAAKLLTDREFTIQRNTDRRLTEPLLRTAGVLVILHPCVATWERTTGGDPRFSPAELRAIRQFVARGGGLLVITEYENDKYGSNIAGLLAHVGLGLTNATVSDPDHCEHNRFWVHADTTPTGMDPELGHLVRTACFYRAGACEVSGQARAAVRAHPTARPQGAVLVASAPLGRGRACVVTDSDLFGDHHLPDHDHAQLWLNLLYWLSLPSLNHRKLERGRRLNGRRDGWRQVREATNDLRALQEADGTVRPEAAVRKQAARCVDVLRRQVPRLRRELTHQEGYLAAVVDDLGRWSADGFERPDFTAALSAFAPQSQRTDGIRHVALFPMYTPNSSRDVRFDAVMLEVCWPDWLARLHRERYSENDKFVSARLIEYTAGYASDCAVLFPETVSIAGSDRNEFGIIFCDREASRYERMLSAAAELLRLRLPPRLQAFRRMPDFITHAYALWDLIHDTSHSRGELPFDPFMVRQRAPYWMYALEELRVDLRSYIEAHQLRSEFPFAEYVCFSILLDRIIRFPVTGARVRNYDALGGQLLFTYLHAEGVLRWRDNRLTIDWHTLPAAVHALETELHALSHHGQVVSKVTYWNEAHALVCRYLTPNVASQWAPDRPALRDESDPRALVDHVHDDEFPLGSFHLSLQRQLAAAGVL